MHARGRPLVCRKETAPPEIASHPPPPSSSSPSRPPPMHASPDWPARRPPSSLRTTVTTRRTSPPTPSRSNLPLRSGYGRRSGQLIVFGPPVQHSPRPLTASTASSIPASPPDASGDSRSFVCVRNGPERAPAVTLAPADAPAPGAHLRDSKVPRRSTPRPASQPSLALA